MYYIGKSTGHPAYPEDLSDDARDFLDKIFKSVPRERANVRQLLAHPFINPQVAPPAPRNADFSSESSIDKMRPRALQRPISRGPDPGSVSYRPLLSGSDRPETAPDRSKGLRRDSVVERSPVVLSEAGCQDEEKEEEGEGSK